MSHPTADAILSRVAGLLPEEQHDQILPALRVGLDAMAAHGDQNALPNLAQQVEAVAAALENGDVQAATVLLGQWGVLASAFGIDAAALAEQVANGGQVEQTPAPFGAH